MVNHYEILGVGEGASPEQIREAYRSKAQKLHPDKPGGDTDSFKQLRESYAILKNPDTRSRYDRGEQVTSQGQNKEDVARNMLAQAFSQAIANSRDDQDMIDAMRGGIGRGMTQVINELERISNQLEKLTKVKNRVKYNGSGLNLFEGVIKQQEQELSVKQRRLEEDMEIGKMAIELLNDYECAVTADDSDIRFNPLFSQTSATGGMW